MKNGRFVGRHNGDIAIVSPLGAQRLEEGWITRRRSGIHACPKMSRLTGAADAWLRRRRLTRALWNFFPHIRIRPSLGMYCSTIAQLTAYTRVGYSVLFRVLSHLLQSSPENPPHPYTATHPFECVSLKTQGSKVNSWTPSTLQPPNPQTCLELFH